MATISETENERMNPAAVERRMTSILVWKANRAISAMASQPMIPLTSAGCFQTISRHRMMMIGRRVSSKDTKDMNHSPFLEL
jgi:hypothetical protein